MVFLPRRAARADAAPAATTPAWVLPVWALCVTLALVAVFARTGGAPSPPPLSTGAAHADARAAGAPPPAPALFAAPPPCAPAACAECAACPAPPPPRDCEVCGALLAAAGLAPPAAADCDVPACAAVIREALAAAARGAGGAAAPLPTAAAAAHAPAVPLRQALSGHNAVRGLAAPPCAVAADAGACLRGPPRLPTRCIVGRHEDHWNFFTTLMLRSREPFALLRFVDGERMILQGATVSTSTQAFSEDKWSWEGGASRLADEMAAALRGHHDEPVFYAFASPADDEAGLRYYLDKTEATCAQVTYANLWVNGFYTKTKAFLLALLAAQAERIVLVANFEGIAKAEMCAGVAVFPGRADLAAAAAARAPRAAGAPALRACIGLPDDAVATWQNDALRAETLAAYVGAAAAAPPGSLFITCGGPLSKPLIAAGLASGARHQFVDFGSTMDEILKGRTTRPYMNPASSYSQIIDPQVRPQQRRAARARERACALTPFLHPAPQWYCNSHADPNWACGLFGSPHMRARALRSADNATSFLPAATFAHRV
jgi:hypothetical protein